MSQEEFFSFEQALDHLRLKEEELRRLVSEGEIRAFRDGETMKLRKRDVEELGRELMGGEVIDLGDADEDLVFEDDGDLVDPGMATEELTAADTLVEELDELGTLELDVEDDLEELEDLGDEDEEEGEYVAAAPAVDESMQPAAFLAILATTLVMLLSFPALISMGDGHTSDLAQGIGGILYDFEGGAESSGGSSAAEADSGDQDDAGESDSSDGADGADGSDDAAGSDDADDAAEDDGDEAASEDE